MKFIQAHESNYVSPRGAEIDHIIIHFTGDELNVAEEEAKELQLHVKARRSTLHAKNTWRNGNV